MRSIIVMKAGGAFRTRAALQGNTRGESGETEGLVRRLVEQGHKVVLYGRVYGEIPGVHAIVQAPIEELDEWATAAAQEEVLRECVRRLEQHAPYDALIHTAGYAPTMSYVDNPKGSTVQASSIRYQAPLLEALRAFDLPRIVVNNDPRTYPRDQEMSLGWPNARPVALLDQCDTERWQVVGGKKYWRKSVYARCESWAYQAPWEPKEKTVDAVVLAHAHIRTGIGKYVKNPSLEAQWRCILSGPCSGLRVYGEGWPGTSAWVPGVEFMGSTNDPLGVLGEARCCPVVSHTPGFMTGKPYVAVSQGCIPLLAGPYDSVEGAPYDHRGLLVPLDSQWRLRHHGSLGQLARALRDKSLYDERLEEMREACTPDWTVLDSLLEDLDGWREWNGKYGGYLDGV